MNRAQPPEPRPAIPAWRVPPPGRRDLIETVPTLAALAAHLAHVPALGVDLETAFAPRETRQRFALLQLAAEGEAWAVDPLRLPDLSPLAPIFANPGIVKVFFAVGGDAPFLEAVGLPLAGVCDVADIGRSAFGRRGDGLQAVVERIFGVVMDKSLQRSDWLRRPLTAPLLAYAYRDAELTLALYHYFAAEYAALTRLHTTALVYPHIPDDVPEWLRAVLEGRRVGNRRVGADTLVQEAGLSLEDDADSLIAECAAALLRVVDVRPRVRLVDAIGELDLFELTPLLIAELDGPSASLRYAAARALGRLGAEDGAARLRDLEQDDAVEDVRDGAARALRAIDEQKAESARQAAEVAGAPAKDTERTAG